MDLCISVRSWSEETVIKKRNEKAEEHLRQKLPMIAQEKGFVVRGRGRQYF